MFPPRTQTDGHAFCRALQLIWAVVLLLAGSISDHAAVISVTNYTASDYTFTSLTIGGTVYSSLVGSTAAIVGPGNDFWIKDSAPALTAGSANADVSGLSYRDGTTNIDTGSIFQFGRIIKASDYIFVSDLGTGDAISFELVNSSNTVIGTYGVSITTTNFGSDLIASTTYATISDSSGAAGSDVTQAQRMVAFRLSDFTGSGDLSAATGIRLSAGNNIWDPSVVGLAIPEPATWAVLAASALFFVLVFRRSRGVSGGSLER